MALSGFENFLAYTAPGVAQGFNAAAENYYKIKQNEYDRQKGEVALAMEAQKLQLLKQSTAAEVEAKTSQAALYQAQTAYGTMPSVRDATLVKQLGGDVNAPYTDTELKELGDMAKAKMPRPPSPTDAILTALVGDRLKGGQGQGGKALSPGGGGGSTTDRIITSATWGDAHKDQLKMLRIKPEDTTQIHNLYQQQEASREIMKKQIAEAPLKSDRISEFELKLSTITGPVDFKEAEKEYVTKILPLLGTGKQSDVVEGKMNKYLGKDKKAPSQPTREPQSLGAPIQQPAPATPNAGAITYPSKKVTPEVIASAQKMVVEGRLKSAVVNADGSLTVTK